MAYLTPAANLPASNAKQHFERKHETISCAAKAGNVRREVGRDSRRRQRAPALRSPFVFLLFFGLRLASATSVQVMGEISSRRPDC